MKESVCATRYKAGQEAVDLLGGRRTRAVGKCQFHSCLMWQIFRSAWDKGVDWLSYVREGVWPGIIRIKESRHCVRQDGVWPSPWNERLDIQAVLARRKSHAEFPMCTSRPKTTQQSVSIQSVLKTACTRWLGIHGLCGGNRPVSHLSGNVFIPPKISVFYDRSSC